MKKNRGLLIAIAIIIGIVLSCAVLPLGGFAILMSQVDTTPEQGPLPAKTWKEQTISGKGTDRILVIPITGIIGGSGSGGLFDDMFSHSELLSQIRQATKDPLIKAIVLRVDSPGGGVVASSELHQALKKFQEEDKLLIVSMGTIAASGGYYISAPADKIYANPDTLTGSLGVIISSLNYEETYKKLGLEQVVYKSGEFKDILSPARPATYEEQKILQTFVDEAYQRFVDIIVEGRELERKNVLELADGRIYSGMQAQEIGLVDEMGGLEDAIEGTKELVGVEDALVVRYRMSGSFSDLLFSKVQQSQQPIDVEIEIDPLGLSDVIHPQVPMLEYRLVLPVK